MKVEGEKPTRLFCSLEKFNAVQKHVPKLIIEKDGLEHELLKQKAIESEIYNYYKELYTDKPVQDLGIEDFLEHDGVLSCPKLQESEKLKMEGMITEEELTRYLKKQKKTIFHQGAQDLPMSSLNFSR